MGLRWFNTQGAEFALVGLAPLGFGEEVVAGGTDGHEVVADVFVAETVVGDVVDFETGGGGVGFANEALVVVEGETLLASGRPKAGGDVAGVVDGRHRTDYSRVGGGCQVGMRAPVGVWAGSIPAPADVAAAASGRGGVTTSRVQKAGCAWLVRP